MNSALEVGDKILEVNGEPIQDSTIEDVGNFEFTAAIKFVIYFL